MREKRPRTRPIPGPGPGPGPRFAVTAAVLLALVAGLALWRCTGGDGALPPVHAERPAAANPAMPALTLKGAPGPAPQQVSLVTADDAGYLSGPPPNTGGSGPFPMTWVRKDGSLVHGLPRPVGVNGGLGLERVGLTGAYQIRHYATGVTVRFTVPPGQTATQVFGADVLLTTERKPGLPDGRRTLHLLEIPPGGGTPVDRLVSGVPDAYFGDIEESVADSRGAAFTYMPSELSGAATKAGVLDFATARLRPVEVSRTTGLTQPSLSGGTAFFTASDFVGDSRIRWYTVDRGDPAAPGAFVRRPCGREGQPVAVLGDWAICLPTDGEGPVRAESVSTGEARTLPVSSGEWYVLGPDRDLYFKDGVDADDRAVRHIALGADGAPAVDVLAPLPRQTVYDVGGVAVDQGQVLIGTLRVPHDFRRTTTYLTASTVTPAADGSLRATPPADAGDLGKQSPDGGFRGSVECVGECLQFTGTGEGSVTVSPWPSPLPTVAASGDYVVRRSVSDHQSLYDGRKRLTTGRAQAAALWGDTLWRPGRERGTVAPVSLPSMRKSGPPVAVGAPCVPREIQVVGRWMYWSCGPRGKAGVYDREAKRLITVPSGYAELADGYLVSQDDSAGRLRITYFPGAVPADRVGTSDFGPLKDQVAASADRRGRFWGVDRFGGPVASLTDAGDVTVTWPRVATSPLAVISTDAPARADLRADGDTYTGVWHLSKPATSWKLTLGSPSGHTVRTFTGGAAGGKVSVVWDGKDAEGRPVTSGTYRWKLTAKAAAAGSKSESASAGGSVKAAEAVR